MSQQSAEQAPATPAPTLAAAARPGRSHTRHKVTNSGSMTFELAPYRVGDRIRVSAVVDAEAVIEGVVTAYTGNDVTITADAAKGDGKYDDWSLDVVTSAIPAPPSPDETEAARAEAVSKLDLVGGQVVGEFARKLIEIAREMDDTRDLAHYVNRVSILFKEHEFKCVLEIDEKNCDISAEELAALQEEANTIGTDTGLRRQRHLDIAEKKKSKVPD